MKIGQKIRNIHTNKAYTIIEIDERSSGFTVYEVANEEFELHRFNTNYTQHYEVIEDKLEEE